MSNININNSSRIFVDMRDEGAQWADRLRQLGFIVEEFYPVRYSEHECRCEQVARSNGTSQPQRVLFSETSPVWSGNHLSQDSDAPLLSSEEAMRLLQLLRLCAPADRKSCTCVS